MFITKKVELSLKVIIFSSILIRLLAIVLPIHKSRALLKVVSSMVIACSSRNRCGNCPGLQLRGALVAMEKKRQALNAL